ncbi:hypothetical protein BKA67DRAFT_138616 [Truncatella angustata]|uniref:Uncharacterized protein n=1 Tax=Truncatella angustata TaxID=152316 RepID=A0A9P8REI0_9PEZI|nr:uncharacterized protein BKA67DRAFT_138616 [Truncatella angustata]KAH6639993.1 hypothetical protein BKA67DRAFT_138616 [Truncatella angustata]
MFYARRPDCFCCTRSYVRCQNASKRVSRRRIFSSHLTGRWALRPLACSRGTSCYSLLTTPVPFILQPPVTISRDAREILSISRRVLRTRYQWADCRSIEHRERKTSRFVLMCIFHSCAFSTSIVLHFRLFFRYYRLSG